MPNVSAGTSASVTLSGAQTIEFSLDQNEEAQVIVTRAGVQRYGGSVRSSMTIGPYLSGDVLTITASRGAVDYTLASYSDPAIDAAESALIQALVSGDGIVRPSASSFAILGDSLSAYAFGAVSPTSVVRTDGVSTVTAAAHGMLSGGTLALYGASEDSFNVSGAVVTRVDANTVTFPNAGINQTATGSFAACDLQKLNQRGYLSWARLGAGNRITLTYVGVQGGATVVTLGSKYVAPAIASGAKNAVVMAGVNNAAGSQTAAQISAEIISSLLDPLAAGGMRVFVMAVLPFSSAHASFAIANPKISAINETLRRYCMSKGSLIWVDGWSALIDPVAATPGNAITGTMDASNLHTSPRGAALVGARLAAAILAQPIPSVDLTMRANIDAFGANANSNNMLEAGLMQGTTGTVNTPVAGLAPTGWIVGPSGTITTATASLQARADGYGNDFQVVVQPGAANAQILFNTQTAQLLGRVTGGSWYQIALEMSASGVSASNCSNVTVWLGLTIDGSAYTLGLINGFGSDTPNPSDIAANTLFLSLPFWIPAGVTITVPLLYINARFSASSASSLTLRAGCAAVRKLV